jgi:hypothetical protein
MATIGLVTVPTPTSSGLTFPLVSDFDYSQSQPMPSVSHRFGENATLSYQTFQTGVGPRKFQFKRASLKYGDRATLASFWEAMQGSYQTFTYNVPQSDRTSFISFTVVFENAPLSLGELVNRTQTGLTFVEVVTTAPSYSISSTCTRFPSSALATALTAQEQIIIPLVHVLSKTPSVPDIYLSDRHCTVGGITYQPRLLDLGEAGSSVVMTQSLSGGSGADKVSFSFNNADRVMTQVMNTCDLKFAEIDLCLYHVNSGILLQLWAGNIVNAMSDGSAVFKVQATDGMYQVSQQYPVRAVSRTCWKTFNDGINCPFATEGSLSGAASGTSCDNTWSGSNGCQAHNMTRYFGGHPAQPQGVLIKNESTGNAITSTSIVSDTIFGEGLQEIWCNQGSTALNAFIVNTLIADVRDESPFMDVLGIVGAGPIMAYSITTTPTFTGNSGELLTNSDGLVILIAPLADGFPAQGFKIDSNGVTEDQNSQLGLRQVVGNDPIPTGDQGYEQFQLTPASTTNMPFAAGTAFVELRYAKSNVVAPTTPLEHSMTVPIAQGLYGWTFDSSGSPTSQGGLTNPFWIAVNSYFRALGIQDALGLAGGSPTLTAEQLDNFVLSSLVNVDGVSGCAQIADLSVTSLVDDTVMETQFQFQGIIDKQKPFRDWLKEMMNSCLGYYTFEFGKLKLGVRENASAVSAYTLGNMLYQSLTLQPIDASFEQIVINFADVEYQFQNNTATYVDQSHAAYYGRAGTPLTKQINGVGICTLSQALRIAATLEREETGGIAPSEWIAARNATWKSTILALDTEPGMVVSVTHPDMPGGTGNFRVQSWSLMKDWSVSITGKTVTASMYALDSGPKPADVLPQGLPVMQNPIPLGQWAPYQLQASSVDLLFPNEWTFAIFQDYMPLADGTQDATISCSGALPVNAFIAGAGAPVIQNAGVTQLTTGGTIPGGITLRLSVCGTNASGAACTPASQIIYVTIPSGTNTNQVTISDIVWPSVAGLTGYVLFASQYDDLICAQATGTLTAGTMVGTITPYTPTSVTFTGPLQRSTWGIPNPQIAYVHLKTKQVIHAGVQGSKVTAVSGSTITCPESIDVALTDNWTGRYILPIGRLDLTLGSQPFAAWKCTAFNPATGIFTLDHAATHIGGLYPAEWSIHANDVITVCFLGYDNHLTPTVFTDAGISNSQDLPVPHTGEAVNSRAGLMMRCIAGKNRGATAVILSNTATAYTLDRPFVLDATSVVIVEAPTWDAPAPASATTNLNPFAVTPLSVGTSNFLGECVLIAGFLVDTAGNISNENDAVMRMCYIIGQAATGSYGLVVASVP